MDISRILDSLNDAQRQAVCAPAGNVRVLAGAGSGKTRVLVHRIAWLLQAENVSPYGILAVTFTNKAAGEMRSRIEQLLGIPAAGLWVGTFHGIAHRLLRAHWKDVDLPQTFQIMDSEDQFRAVKRVVREMGLDEEHWSPREAQWFINARKDEGLRPQHLEHHGDPRQRHMIAIYENYEAACQRAGLVDFAELLLRAHELWLKHPDILGHYQQRFRHILVDEFQDTNTIQYAFVRLLAGQSGQVFAVGDDDQSIYGWRGARVENIHQFAQDFTNTSTFRLEQNYRSTSTILNGANALIANNTDRLGKHLWTAGQEGDLIRLYGAFNEQEEARYVIEQIQDWIEQGGARSECALLYRSNAQSRVLEEVLFQARIPYRVYGGLRFFERQEIKDALAYLRLAVNHEDDASLERIINVPTRGIGNRTVAAVRDEARHSGSSMWQAMQHVIEHKQLAARALGALQNFVQLIEKLGNDIRELELHEQIEQVIQASGLIAHYEKEKGERGQARIENLEELVSAGRAFEPEQIEDDEPEPDPLSAFLSHAALEAGERQADEWDDCVQLMTLHSAKGLEFKQVFMCGMEEGLFPHRLSAENPGRLEEERRLCYVGMTRAMEQLTLSYAEKRRLYGEEHFARPSRFLKEIPPELIEEQRLTGVVTPAASLSSGQGGFSLNESGFALGQRVCHDTFGEGVVLNYEGEGRHARVQVNFESEGSKWLMVEYANLMVC
ncbi:DNA helicase II [Thiohalophilus sp.]|uniref:DNA helicase II n=1 Tax=Thiohalophilus sp. TaxID=3028392 RepID=UPI002ACEC489|nr:DNA helicase II [Thiohalophilus sp.]MDZ7661372.1 DNA helicase II [Thiohalophilus sp.]